MLKWLNTFLGRQNEEQSSLINDAFDLSEEQVEELLMVSCFDVKQLKVLRQRFKEVDVDGDNFISKEEFEQIKEFKYNPLVDRIFACFNPLTENMKKPVVSFKEFVKGLSVLSEDGPKSEKLRFAFMMQDYDNDKKIDHHDLLKYLQCITNVNISDEEQKLRVRCQDEEHEVGADTEGKGIDLWPSPKRLEYNENKIAALKAAKATHHEIKVYVDRLKYLQGEANLHKIVKRTFEDVASDVNKEYITYEDFLKAVAQTDFVGKLCINLK